MPFRPDRLRSQAPAFNVRAALAPVLRYFAQPSGPVLALVIGVVLSLPATFAGFSFADHALRLQAQGTEARAVSRSAFDLFSWLDADDAEHSRVADLTGMWSLPSGTAVRAPRPIASLLHAAEEAWWPDQAWAMHLHNLVWYALLLAVLGATYRTSLGPSWIAAVALLIFAVDDIRAPVVASIASRHELIGATFAVAALLVHHRWRSNGASIGVWAGPLLFLIALASSETSIAMLAYLLAYVVVLERAPGPEQWASFAGYAVVALLWIVVVAALGYSVTDPLRSPLTALVAVASRGPLLALAQLGVPFATEALGGPAAFLLSAVAVTVIAAVVWTIRPLLERHPLARFWALGAVLALPAAALGQADDGALLYCSLGFSALVAQFFGAILRTARAGRLSSLKVAVTTLGGAWLGLHIVVAPLLLPIRSLAARWEEGRLADADASLPTQASLADQQLVILRAPDLERGPGLLIRRAALGTVLPESTRVLTIGSDELEVARTSDDHITVTLGTAMLPVPLGGDAPVTELAAARFTNGQRIEIEGFHALLERVEDGRARRIEFTFDVPCDNESLRWVAWDGEAYRDFAVPPVGARERLPAARP